MIRMAQCSTALERLFEYMPDGSLPAEAARVAILDSELSNRKWPQTGNIVFEGVEMRYDDIFVILPPMSETFVDLFGIAHPVKIIIPCRYRDDLPIILRGLSFAIEGGEKVLNILEIATADSLIPFCL
jgi:ABC-type multidrug transport system fused ATPase/permease subunit